MQYLNLSLSRTGILLLLLIGIAFSVSTVPATAQTLQTQTLQTQTQSFDELTDHSQQIRTIWVPLYKSHILRLHRPVNKISVGNPKVADILIMRSDQLYVLGQGLGTTNVLLWDKDNRLISAFDIEVTHDLDTLKTKLFELLPGEPIEVHSSQGAIVLSGQVSSLVKMNTAVEIARSFAMPTEKKDDEENEITNVVNLMSVGGAQQVMLKVTVAEISRSALRKFGVKFHALNSGSEFKIGAVSGGATFPDAVFTPTAARVPVFSSGGLLGPVLDEFAPSDLSIVDKGFFTSFLDGDFLFNIALDAAKDNGSAKVLAEPTLTALSGQEAEFLSGGEFPIPVPRGDDGVTIEFKEFGVGLKFLPVVLDSNRINLKLNISVSELTSAASVALGTDTNATFFIPSLSKRGANATVELGDGQTISIAGLINETTREVVSNFPGLSDVPVLGHLFRSQEFEKGETELVILVTPHLAKPLGPEGIALPTDGYIEPSDFEFYMLGRNQGAARKSASPYDELPRSTRTQLPANDAGLESQFGHQVN